jgi:perosamine synthetase
MTKIGRTLPPASVSCGWRDLWFGMAGAFSPDQALRARIDELRREFDVGHVFPVSSGTAALTLTLSALASLSDRTEVVMPAYTCFSVPAAVVHAGLRPVLCDIVDSTFDFDHAQLPHVLTTRTLCVIAHHLFGIPSNIERTRAICRERGIFLIEDAAQAMGACHGGRALGTQGDVGIFSFGRGKNITCGSGGLILTSSDRIAQAIGERYQRVPPPRCRELVEEFVSIVLMMVFVRPWLYWIPAALPFLRLGTTVFPREVRIGRLSGFKAGTLKNWRSRLTESNHARSRAADDLRRRVPAGLSAPSSHPLLRLPLLTNGANEKERLYCESKRRGLGLSPAYPTALDQIPTIRVVLEGRQYPAATRVASQLLTLPTHRWLREKDKRAIEALCRDSLGNRIPDPRSRIPGPGGALWS